MYRLRPERSLLILMLAFGVVVTAIGGTVWLYISQQNGVRWVNHTLRVEDSLSAILSSVQAAESSQRGYMLTGQKPFLAPFEETKSSWRGDMLRLRAEVNDNEVQRQAAAELEQMVGQRLALLQLGVDRRAHDMTVAPEGFRPGLIAMAKLRAHVAAMKAHEERLLRTRSLAAGRLSNMVSVGLAVSTALIILLGLMALQTARRRMEDAIASQRALADVNSRLVTEATEREAAEAQMRQMQKMESIGQLTGGIAHDFNNMLAIVIGSLDMARRRLAPGGDPRIATGIDNATEGAQRAAQLTARLLAFSRQQPLDPQPTDVNKLVGGMSELLRRTIGEGVRVETVLAGGLWRASIDAGQLESAIINLCVNARDAMPGGGRLTIETANAHLDDAYAAIHHEVVSGQYVVVSVTDTGTGMPAEVVERAFDPFFTTKGVGKGTGLGLSQVFGLVNT